MGTRVHYQQCRQLYHRNKVTRFYFQRTSRINMPEGNSDVMIQDCSFIRLSTQATTYPSSQSRWTSPSHWLTASLSIWKMPHLHHCRWQQLPSAQTLGHASNAEQCVPLTSCNQTWKWTTGLYLSFCFRINTAATIHCVPETYFLCSMVPIACWKQTLVSLYWQHTDLHHYLMIMQPRGCSRHSIQKMSVIINSKTVYHTN
jgi:hypothetical protein